MKTFINDFIDSLTFRGQQRAYRILEDSRLEKSQVDLIARKLSDEGIYNNIQLAEEKLGGVIKAGPINTSLRDVSVRMNDLYNTSNNISLVLNSNISILTSDIKALHDQLTALEKATTNYSFLLSDGGTYDYAYLETFNDTRNREDFEFLIPDRAGLLFGDDEQALVLNDEGAISMPQDFLRTYPMSGSILETNCSSFVTSANPLANALNTNAGTGWRMAVSSFSPITSTLPSFSRLYPGFEDFPGANIVIELILASPSPCDSVKIAPFSDAPFELVQLELYKDLEDTNKTDLLDAPVIMDGTRNFYFQLQSVAKVKLYMRQFLYRRNGIQPLSSEDRYRRVTNETGNKNPLANINLPVHRDENIQRDHRMSFLSRLVQRYLVGGDKNRARFGVSSPISLFAPGWGSSRGEVVRAISSHRNPYQRWSNQTVRGTAIESVVRSRLPEEFKDAFMPRRSIQTDDLNAGNRMVIYPFNPVQSENSLDNNVQYNSIEQFKYEYNIGIQSVQIGNGISGFKGVFVSKILPSPSDVGEVKIKVSDLQYIETPSDKDQPIVTSVEYSVSNQAKPDSESDWVPIMPVGTERVTAERFLPDTIGKGYFRFAASMEDNIDLFKNGYQVEDIDIYSYLIRSSTRQTAIGIKLPIGYATAQDIFTVNYVPAVDNTIVNFEKAGYATPPLVSSFDEDGAGEGFVGSYGQLVIDLKYAPYIDYGQVNTSTYNTTTGLTPYSPVIVRFDDGTIAYNLTNYKGGSQSVLNPASDFSYVQNGNSLMFNKAVDKAFRVYYQYLPNNLRFRAVLRSNTNEYVSPKVDFVQVKAKTRKADAKRK